MTNPLEDLNSPQWLVRRNAIQSLSTGDASPDLKEALWRVVGDDPDDDVRAAAAIALGDLKDEKILGYLLDNYSALPTPVRFSTAWISWKRPTSVPKSRVADIWRALLDEFVIPVQAAFARALVLIDPEEVQRRTPALLEGYGLPSIRAGVFLWQIASPEIANGEILDIVNKAAARMGEVTDSFELDRQQLRLDPAEVNLLNKFLTDPSISDIRAASFLLWYGEEKGLRYDDDEALARMGLRVSGGLQEWVRNRASNATYGISYSPYSWGDPLQFQEDLTSEAMNGLQWEQTEAPSWPDVAISWLASNPSAYRNSEVQPKVIEALWPVLSYAPQAFDVLVRLVGIDAVFARLKDEPSRNPGAIGRAILRAEDGELYEQLREHAADAAPFVGSLLNEPEPNRASLLEAAGWIRSRAAQIDPESVSTLINALTNVRERAKEDPELQNRASAAVIELSARQSQLRIQPQVDALRGPDEEMAHTALNDLDRQSTSDAHRALVDEWVAWLATGRKSRLVESAADMIRRKPECVLILLNHLATELVLTDQLAESVRQEFMPMDIRSLVDRLLPGAAQLTDMERMRLSQWLRSTGAGISRSEILVRTDELEVEEIQSVIDGKMEAGRLRRQEVVHRRVSRLLLEMTEERFFVDSVAIFEAVGLQLQLHAVPMLSQWLTTGGSAEVRENVARVLGNVGGKSAVDALARAVSGEELTRERRQQLLSKYYLDPSKEQSDEASRLLTSAVSDARGTLRVLQTLNFVFAAVGLTFLAVGLYLLLFASTPTLQFAGGAISVLSFFAMIIQIVREPLDRIQDAMNRLVQLETAFTSFIWELNLNSTFIQSQYVANGVLSTSEIGDTLDRIEGAMRLSMDLVSSYADQNSASRLIPVLSSVAPGVVDKGDRVRVKGAWLAGGRSAVARHGISVLLDHRVVAARVLSVSDAEVQFRFDFPSNRRADPDGAGMRWLSLSVNGQETNAVPLVLRNADSTSPDDPGSVNVRSSTKGASKEGVAKEGS